MSFSNGYDSGYSDCEAENRKRWEREAVERYKAENPPQGGGSSGGPDVAPRLFTVSLTTSENGAVAVRPPSNVANASTLDVLVQGKNLTITLPDQCRVGDQLIFETFTDQSVNVDEWSDSSLFIGPESYGDRPFYPNYNGTIRIMWHGTDPTAYHLYEAPWLA